MAVAVNSVAILSAMLALAHGSYYFATHESYKSLTYNITSYLVIKLSGDVSTVTQTCRRNCVFQLNCAAYNITLLSGNEDLGVFNCCFFDTNACSWQRVGLKDTPASNFIKLWEKLDAKQMKPKPCTKYCQVQYKGSCKDCRGYDNLKGLDCDIAPQLCSDYMFSDWMVGVSIWPWSFYGKMLRTSCYQDKTRIINTLPVGTTTNIYTIGRDLPAQVQNMDDFQAWQQTIDWGLISELTKLAKKKILNVRLGLAIGSRSYAYSGLQISPRGDLSINASINTIVSYGIPFPLAEVPFVYESSCGAFWQFDQSVSLCDQRSILFNYTGIRWDWYNQTSNGQAAILLV